MSSLLKELKKRRLELKFKQSDMMARIGFSKQQYNHLERKGNPRLETLELVAKGLNSEIMLVPLDKVTAVKALLEDSGDNHLEQTGKNENLEDDPWNDILSNDEADS